jgi:Ger(x)C family germination protein
VKNRTLLLFIWTLLSSILLTACWDRREINDLAFVIATGVDTEKEGKYRTAVQVPLPSAMGGSGSSGGGGGTGGEGPYYVDSGTGKNIRDSNMNLQNRMSRSLYFAHRRVVVIGEDLAKKGMEGAINVILIQPQSRLSTFLLISKGDASEILSTQSKLEQLPGEAIREMAKNGIGMTVKDVLQDLERPGKEPIIPVIEKAKIEIKGKATEEMEMSSFAILKGDKVIFTTNSKESRGVLWLLDSMRGKSVTFPYGDEGELNIKIIQSKLHRQFSIVRGKPRFTLMVKATGTLMENEPNVSLEDPKVYTKALASFEKEIRSEISALLDHSHSEGSDIAGFGWYLYKNHNKRWEREWKKDWGNSLKDMEVKVTVDGEIQRLTNTGLKFKE